MKTHTCECGYEVKYDGELDGPIVHRPDGRHEWSVRIDPALHPKGVKEANDA